MNNNLFQIFEIFYIFVAMKLTAKILLKPTEEQKELLLATLEEANTACNEISTYAWQHKIFSQFKIHKGVYYTIKGSFNLSSQLVVRCISKVADSYKLDKKVQRTYRRYGSIAYDSRILSYNFEKQIASIWTVEGRQKIAYATGEHHAKLLQYQKGESDLAYIKGKFYLLATVDIPDVEEESFDDVLGVDLGITNIATDDTGKSFQGKDITKLRKKRKNIRASLQAKAHKGASRSTMKNTRRILKRLAGREKQTVKLTNHTIAKKIVEKAKEQQKGIALETLKGIRKNTNKKLRKSQKGLHNSWAFYQLQSFIKYKAKKAGVPVYFVAPAYTSKTCSSCHHIGKRNGEKFSCEACGVEHADVNAAKNIRKLGIAVTYPENSALYCDMVNVAVHCA